MEWLYRSRGLDRKQPKEQTHRRVCCLHSPASFHYSAVMNPVLPRAWDGAVEGHRLQTHQSRYLAVEISYNGGR